MSKYFSSFQNIYYANSVATNILSRVGLTNTALSDLSSFYPYTIKEGERADTIAEKYYEDPGLDWLVYFSNRIVDPYFEWPLSSTDFNKFIVNKYGNVDNANEKILFFRVNWYGDDSVLSPAAYNALGIGQKKYWKPISGYRNEIVNYERKELDLIIDTNKVVGITCTVSGPLTEGEIVKQFDGQGNVIATGTALFCNTTYLTVSRVTGEFINGPFVTGQTSKQTAHATNVAVLSTPIPPNEVVYWEGVSAYTHEEELNESRKTIYLIDKKYTNKIEKQMRELLK